MSKKVSKRYQQLPSGGLLKLMKKPAYQSYKNSAPDLIRFQGLDAILDELFGSTAPPLNAVIVPMAVHRRVKEAVTRPQILSDIMRKNAGNRRRQARSKR